MNPKEYQAIKKDIKNKCKKYIKSYDYDLRFEKLLKDVHLFHLDQINVHLYYNFEFDYEKLKNIFLNISFNNRILENELNKVIIEHMLNNKTYKIIFNLYKNKSKFNLYSSLNNKQILFDLINMILKYYNLFLLNDGVYLNKNIKIIDNYEHILKFFDLKSILIESDNLTSYELFVYIIRLNFVDKKYLYNYINNSNNVILKECLSKYISNSYFDIEKLKENELYINSKIEKITNPEKVAERIIYGILDFYEIIYKKLLTYTTKKEIDLNSISNLYIKYINTLIDAFRMTYSKNLKNIKLNENIYLELLLNKIYSLEGSEKIFKIYNLYTKDFIIFGFKPNITLDCKEFSINIALENECEELENYINIFTDFLTQKFNFNFRWYLDNSDILYQKSLK